MSDVIGPACVDVKDKSCINDCPVDCIYEGDRMLYIHPDECIDCGACEPVCPVEAIRYNGDLTPDHEIFQVVNREVFQQFGSPGGSMDTGPVGSDHPMVASLPAAPQVWPVSSASRIARPDLDRIVEATEVSLIPRPARPSPSAGSCGSVPRTAGGHGGSDPAASGSVSRYETRRHQPMLEQLRDPQ